MPGSANFMPQTTAVASAALQVSACSNSGSEGTAASATESFLHVGNVVVRRENTSRARIQVVEPLVGDLSVTQVLNHSYLLPGTPGEERVLQAPETSPISES